MNESVFNVSVTVHTFYSNSVHIEICGTLCTTVISKEGDVIEEKSFTLDEGKLFSFIALLDKIGVFAWESHYNRCCMLDGTVWTVKISSNHGQIHSAGTNGYPDNWAPFYEALRKLAGLAE
ncbi:MAG: hypothetical protein KGZ63_01590 [Clostridiales bacterium]|jgi:hypothetical protein|nr:hypothetical protein [Clostridiales bacterium]